MSELIQLLTRYRELGVKLWASDGALRFKAPEGVLQAHHKAELKQYKAEILAFLLAQEKDGSALAPILPAPRDQPLPLSFSQARLWFFDQYQAGSAAYHIPMMLNAYGNLSVGAFEQANRAVIARHESLRTTFGLEGDTPVQYIATSLPWSLNLLDFQDVDLSSEQRDRLLHGLFLLPFNLVKGPLLRVTILRLPDRHVISVVMHHIISDGWSMGLYHKELLHFYACFAKGVEPPRLPAFEIQYPDFAMWQRTVLEGEELNRQLAFWQNYLAGYPALLDLPTDFPRPAEMNSACGQVMVHEEGPIIDSLMELAQKADCSVFMVLLGGFSLLLSRYSGQQDILIGSPIANRNRGEIEPLIGFFVNTLVYRNQINLNDTFLDLLRNLRAQSLEVYRNQDMPFERLIEVMVPNRSLAYPPLFQVMLGFQAIGASGSMEMPGVRFEGISGRREETLFNLTLDMMLVDNRLNGALDYSSDLFSHARATRLLRHLFTLLDQCNRFPGQKMARLALMDDQEARHLANHLLADPPEPAPSAFAHTWVALSAARYPENLALWFDPVDGAELQLTYTELVTQAQRLAYRLRALGIGLESRVGICMPASAERYVSLLAVLFADGVYIPIDENYPRDRMAYLCEDAGLKWVLTTASTPETVNSLTVQTVEVALPIEGPLLPKSPVDFNHGAYMIYTSGSTGRPKGVLVPHFGLVNLIHHSTRSLAIDAHTRFLQCSAFPFDASVWEWLMPWSVGSLVVCTNRHTLLPGPHLIPLLERWQISHISGTPSWLAAWQPPEQSTVKVVVSGGEALLATLAATWADGRRVFNAYGPTENTIVSTLQEATPSLIQQRLRYHQAIPLGRTMPGMSVYVVNPCGDMVPIGIPGELWVGGSGVTRGYLGRPSLTARAFIPNPFVQKHGQRLYRTGDLVRIIEMADGLGLEFLGRIDFQVKLRGQRIELGEIEAVLAETPGVSAAIVRLIDQPGLGQHLIAYLQVLEGPLAVDPLELAGIRLPAYMVPSQAILLETFPTTPTGKVDLRALPLPQALPTEEKPLPCTPLEQAVAVIWAELLEREPATIGRTDNFFTLGGHSLMAVRIVNRIEEQLGVRLAVREVFEKPTLDQLALLLDQRGAFSVTSPAHAPIPALVARGSASPILSLAQRTLWFVDQLEGGDGEGQLGSAYNIPAGWVITGPISIQALTRAMGHLVARHDILRSCYPQRDGQPVVVFLPESAVALRVLDLRGLPDPQQAAQAYVRRDSRQRFLLDKGPLFRATLLWLGETQSILFLNQHHIIADGWSMGLFKAEFTVDYARELAELPPAEPARDLDYWDYAYWQQRLGEAGILEFQRTWWRSALAAVPPRIELTADKPRPAYQTYAGAHLPIPFAPGTGAALAACNAAWGTTTFMTTHAVLSVLLSRLSGQDVVCIGSPSAGRHHPALERMYGMFVTTLAIPSEVTAGSFSAHLHKTRDQILSCFAHSDLPFDQVVDAVQPVRDLSHAPLFQVMLSVMNLPSSDHWVGGVTLETLSLPIDTLKYELEFTFQEHENELYGQLSYNPDLFEASTASRMAQWFANLTQQVCADPGLSVTSVALVSEEERALLLVDLTHSPSAPGQRIHDLIHAWVVRTPEAPALVYDPVTGPELGSLSYRELDGQANRLAHELRARGIGLEDRVGICIPPSLERMVGVLAVLKAGGFYVPLDPDYPADRLHYLVEDAQLEQVLVHRSLAERVWPEAVATLIVDLEQPGRATPPPDPSRPDSAAYIIYTSGSTGRPKGVVLCHEGLCQLALHQRQVFEVTPESRVLQLASFNFDVSISEWANALVSGACLYFAPRDHLLPGPQVLEHLQRWQITHLMPTPAWLAALDVQPCTYPRVIVSGGEACTPQLAARWGEGRRFINAYGPTENTICTTSLVVEPDLIDFCRTRQRVLPLGPSLGHVYSLVLDRRGQLAPLGCVGELCVGGSGVARGYLNRPALTARQFVPDPFSGTPGSRLYRTGDLVRRVGVEAGWFDYLGRFDHQVKIRGLRIELGEIEAVLSQAAGVDRVVVRVQESAGAKILIAYARTQETGPEQNEQLRAFAAAHLPDYMVPTQVICLAEFPLTPAGKLDLQALPKADLSGSRLRLEPTTPSERALAQIWSDLLEVDLDRVGAQDDFFQVGGHSLLVTRLVNRIQAVFGVSVPVRTVFERPMLADLAALLDQSEGMTSVAIPRLARSAEGEQRFPQSHAQRRLWFLQRLEPQSFAYNMSFTLRFEGVLDPAALESAMTQIFTRHEIMRTRFYSEDGQDLQIVLPPFAVSLPVLDLSGLSGERQHKAIRSVIQRFSTFAFDLAQRPPHQQLLIRVAADNHLLASVKHHIIFDGWSFAILTRELVHFYSAALGQPAAPLPALGAPYADFSVWQNQLLESSRLEEQLAWWRTYLAGVPRGIRPEPDHSVSQPSTRGANATQRVAAETVEGLTQLAAQERTTLFSALLAGFAVVLSRHGGGEDLVLGYPMASRNHPDLEQTMGMFLNNLVLRLDLSGNPSYRELLGRAKTAVTATLAHGDVPFERLVEALQPERNLGGHPFFEVALNLVNTPNETLSLPGLHLHSLSGDEVEARQPMNLYLYPAPDGTLGLNLVYMVDLYQAERVACFLAQYAELLKRVVVDPDLPVRAFRLVDSVSRDLLADPAVPLEIPALPGLPELLEDALVRFSNRTALLFGETWSYATLALRISELRATLARFDLQAGQIVAIHGRRSPGLVVAMAAVLRQGGILLTVDATQPLARRLSLMTVAQPTLLLDMEDDEVFVASVNTGLVRVCLDAMLGTVCDAPASGELPWCPFPADLDPAYLFFTSGSTGVPKGVLGNHRGLAHFLTWQRATFEMGPNDRGAQLINLSFDAILRDIFLPLISGASLCLPPTDTVSDAGVILPWLAQAGVTFLHAVPSLVSAWLAEEPAAPKPSPRLLFLSGEPVTAALATRWANTISPLTTLVNFYGPTETTFIKTWKVLAQPPEPGPQAAGKALPQTHILVLDEERPCSVGELGEIAIRTPFRSSGYFHDPVETERRFQMNPFGQDPEDLIYRTGDRGRFRANGDLEVLGRLDFQLKIRGVRVEPGEIQAVLESHPGVAESVVMAKPGPSGDLRLIAWFTTPAQVEPPSPASLRKFLRERLAEALVPSAYVAMSAWPLLANGKLDRGSLPEPGQHDGASAETFVEATTPTQLGLLAIWTELLGLAQPCGLHDDFFAMGGHSLLATRVATRIQTRFGLTLALKDLFAAPTLGELAHLIDSNTGEGGFTPSGPVPLAHARGQAPASYAQARLWFLDRFAEDNRNQATAYNMITGMGFRGHLAVSALVEAIQGQLQRHESLRTSFFVRDDQPWQQVHPYQPVAIDLIDLSGLGSDVQSVLEPLFARFAAQPFDLSQAPLFRARLVRLAQDHHTLLAVQHHSVSDGWSQTLFSREVTQAYVAALTQQPLRLPPLSLTYSDYAVWQRQMFENGKLSGQVEWWRAYLLGAPSHLDLIPDKPRPPMLSFSGARVPVQIEAPVYNRLVALCQRLGATPFMALQAMAAVLLSRYSHQNDLNIGSPSAGRSVPELEHLIGMFVSTLVFRHQPDARLSFREFLQATRTQMLGVFAHQDVPFDYLVEALQPERDTSRSPLFQVMLVLQNLPSSGTPLSGLEVYGLETPSTSAKFELSWVLYETGNGLQGMLEYATDLFEAATVSGLAQQFAYLAEVLTATPDQPLASVSLLDAAARQVLLQRFAPVALEEELVFPQLFSRTVTQFPDQVALVYDPADGSGNSRAWTYHQLDAHVGSLATELRNRGIGPETAVAIFMDPCPERLVAVLAVLEAGGYFLPLDPDYPPERIAYMLDDAGAALLLCDHAALPKLPASDLTSLVVDMETPLQRQSPPTWVSPLQAAYLIYTSGSTGRPKGVVVPHLGLCPFARNIGQRFGIDRNTRFFQIVAFSFDAAIVEWCTTLTVGGTVVTVPRSAQLPGPHLRDLFERLCITHLTAAASWLTAVDIDDCPYPQVVIPGGEACPPQLAERWARHRTVINAYGPTENTIGSTTQHVSPALLTACQERGRVIPLGQPLEHISAYVVDRFGQLTPSGVPGELVHGGPSVTRGYFQRPALTASVFVPNPFSSESGSRLYRTGDLVRWSVLAGITTLDFLGRIDHQVKLRGLRIELGEIETQLAQSPGIDRAHVRILELPGIGQQLVAYAQTPEGVKPAVDPLSRLNQVLPAYMVPNTIVYLHSFPTTPAGKIDSARLPRPDLGDAAEVVPPQTPSEHLLVAIWADLLGFDPARIGRHSHFFSLGGHSLLAVRVINQIQEQFGQALAIRDLFERPVLADLAAFLDGQRGAADGVDLPELVPSDGIEVLSPAQTTLWFVDLLEGSGGDGRLGGTYNIPAGWRMRGPLVLDALERALAEVVSRHEILRACYPQHQGAPQVAYLMPEALALRVFDYRGLDGQQDLVAAFLASEAHFSFPLARGPLFRASLLWLDQADFALILNQHHIIADGWSMGLLKNELLTAYARWLGGGGPVPPRPRFQYRDFAAWQQRLAASGVLDRQLTWWQTALADLPKRLTLPTDHPRPLLQTFNGARLPLHLPSSVSQGLLALQHHLGATSFMTLHGLLAVLLARLSGQDQLAIGSPVAGRHHAALENMLGMFVTTLAIPHRLVAGTSLRQVLVQTRQVVLDCFAHQHVSFDRVVEAVQPERDLSHTPLFQVMLSVMNLPQGEQGPAQLSLEPLMQTSDSAKFELEFTLMETEAGFQGSITYNTDLFQAETLQRFNGHLVRLAEAWVTNPDQTWDRVGLLSPEEQTFLLQTWNAVSGTHAPDTLIQNLVFAWRFTTPEAEALAYDPLDGRPTTRLSYAGLCNQAYALAHRLQRLGVGPETVVGICMPPSLERMVAVLGILCAGGLYVPIDPDAPEQRRHDLVADAGLQHLLVGTTTEALSWPEQLTLETLSLGEVGSAVAPAVRITPDFGAYIIYTSGSTGKPKGVLLTHRSLCNLASQQRRIFEVQPTDRVLQLASFSFDVSISEWVNALCSGACLQMAPRDGLLPTAQVVQHLDRWGITHIMPTPAWLATLEAPFGVAPRVIVSGGEACTPQLAARWGEGRRFINAYGPTENTICTTAQVVGRDVVQRALVYQRVLPLGQPLGHLTTYVLDRRGELVPRGCEGELWTGGLGVGRGYLGQPRLTARAFVPDPFAKVPGARAYRTGDLVRLAGSDGTLALEFLGRIDHQVKIRGLRIELGEIEAVLAQAPGVTRAVVLVNSDPRGNKTLVAYLGHTDGQAAELEALRAFAAQRLPDYMVPTLVSLDAFPTTPAGKLDLKALPQPEWSTDAADRRPESAVGIRVAAIWAEVLGKEVSELGLGAHFFNLGGHSLMAVRVLNRLREAFSIELAVRDLFERPVLGDLIDLVEPLVAHVSQENPDVLGDRQIPDAPLFDKASDTLAESSVGASGSKRPVLEVCDEPEILSDAQAAMWFLDQIEGSAGEQRLGGTYNIPAGWRVRGLLDIGILAQTVTRLVTRHAILRAAYPQNNGSPEVIHLDPERLSLRLVDLRALDEPEHAAFTYVREELARAFALATGPLFRATVLRLSLDDHVLFLNQHHIISDGWSMALLRAELTETYARLLVGHDAAPPAPAFQYRDFAHWQRRLKEAGALDQQLAWWKRELADVPPRLELVTDKPRPLFQSFRGSRVALPLTAETSSGLTALSNQHQASSFMTLHAAVACLLFRLSGQSVICLGSPTSGRHHMALESMLGMFVNTLAIPSRITPQQTFSDLLLATRSQILACFAHQDVSLDRVVEAVQPERDLSHPPLFQVLLSVLNVPSGGQAVAGVELEPLSLSSDTAKFELEFNFSEAGSTLGGALTYNSDLFTAASAERLARQLVQLLDQVVTRPQTKITAIDLLSHEERHALVVGFNTNPEPVLAQTSILPLIQRWAQDRPRQAALLFDPLDGGSATTLTYNELESLSRKLADVLGKRGVGLETRVGLCLPPSCARLVGVLGVLHAGGVYVPIDPDYPAERIAHIVSDARIRLVLTYGATKEMTWPEGVETIALNLAELTKHQHRSLSRSWLGNEAAYMIYTSGSTGRPKGIVVPHAGIVNLITETARILEVGPNSRILQMASFAFDAATWEWALALGNGATLILAPRQALLPGPHLDSVFERWELSHLLTSPSWIAAMEPPSHSYPRYIVAGSEAGLPQVAARWAVGRHYFNGYGPTEITVVCSVFPIEPEALTYSQNHQRPLPIGKSFARMEQFLMDRWGCLAPFGTPGELWIGGIGVSRGYLDRPGLTAQVFVPHPFSKEPGARLYRSGDLARIVTLASGRLCLDFIGRIDFQVKLRGQRIELAEIEAVLSETPGVSRAVVQLLGKGEQARLVAYLQTEGLEGDPLALAKGRLPQYMVPSQVVTLVSFPTTSSGKLDIKALPLPQVGDILPADQQPLTPDELALAELWAQVLGCPVETLGPVDHFFERGGHSLLAVRLSNQIRSHFRVDLPVRDLFEFPRLAEQAATIAKARIGGLASLSEPMSRNGAPRQLSLAQSTLWFLDQLEGSGGDGRLGGAYTMPSGWLVDGPLDVPALADALALFVRRHEILRSAYPNHQGLPQVVLLEPEALALRVLDLRGLTGQDDIRQRYLDQELHHSFKLATGPLFRATVLWLEADRYAFVVNQHHIIADGWSMGLLKNELLQGYAASVRGEQLPEPAPGLDYWDYAHWQHQRHQGGQLDQQLAWWREQLQPLPTRIALPIDKPRPSVQTFQGASLPIALSPETSAGLTQLEQELGLTPFMTFHALLALLLGRHSHQNHLCIGSPVAGRGHTRLESIYGMFVSMLPIPHALAPNSSLRDHLRVTRQRVLQCFAHGEVPFDRIVEAAQPQRDLSHPPLFQVILSVLNLPAGDQLPGSVSLEPIRFGDDLTKYELSFTFQESPDLRMGLLQYNTDLFTAESMTRLLDRFALLAAEVVRDPDQRCARVPLATTLEDRNLLLQLNAVPWTEVSGRIIADQVHDWAQQTPDALALVFAQAQGSEQQLTYAELDRRCAQLAHRLQRRGIGCGSRIGICMPPAFERMIAVLAIHRLGGCYLPLDPEYPSERLHYMVQDAQVDLVLSHRETEGLAWPQGVSVTYIALKDLVDEVPLTLPARDPALPAYLIYTSGSTGNPKGVLCGHAPLNHLVAQLREPLGVGPETRYLQLASFNFDASVFEWALALSSGGSFVLVPRADLLPCPETLSRLAAWRITHITPTPAWLSAVPLPEDSAHALYPLVVVSGGEVCPPQLAQRWSRGRRFFNAYGPTENAIVTTLASVDATTLETCQHFQRGIPLGRTFGKVTTYLLDRHGELVPAGVSGELVSGGVGLAFGYLGRPSLTAERFVPDPFGGVPGARLYRTGDLVRLIQHASGSVIDYLGRIDHQVKLRGFRIELGEVEAALVSIPEIEEAVALIQTSSTGNRFLIAYVTGNCESVEQREAIRSHLKSRLPEYMVPAHLLWLGQFPKSGAGKIDRQSLAAQVNQHLSYGSGARVLPRSAREHQLAEIWSQLLGHPALGVTQDFFALGGHSLLAVRLADAIQQTFGQKLPVSALFLHPTIETQARLLEQRHQQQGPLVTLQAGQSDQEPPWFFVHPVGGQVFWYLPLARELQPATVYALEAPGLNHGEPLRELDQFVQYYVAALQQTQPQGPYRLLGWSAGGTLAHAMASVLERQGHVVEVVMLDAFRITQPLAPNPKSEILHFLADLQGGEQTQPNKLVAALAHAESAEEVWTALAAHQLLPEGWSLDQLQRYQAVSSGVLNAITGYMPRPFEGRIRLIRASANGHRPHGWDGLKLEIAMQEGSHYTLLNRNPKALAALISGSSRPDTTA